jgi:hypothetical protein
MMKIYEDAATRLRVADKVYGAFDLIERDKLTLRQISERRLFPANWCYVLGYAKRRDDDALDNR